MAAPRAGVASERRKFDENLRFGPFELNLTDRRLLRDGHPVALAPKPYDTLVCFVQEAPRVVSKQELLNAIWPDIFVTDDGLVQCVVEIRRLLGDSPREPRYVETVPRRGY